MPTKAALRKQRQERRAKRLALKSKPSDAILSILHQHEPAVQNTIINEVVRSLSLERVSNHQELSLKRSQSGSDLDGLVYVSKQIDTYVKEAINTAEQKQISK